MFIDTKIEKKVDIEEFLGLIGGYAKAQIECTEHTFFRLSKKQKEIFTCGELRIILIENKPFLVGLQYNKNYAVFYKYDNKNLKIILNLHDRKVK